MTPLRSIWLLPLTGLLLAACSSSAPAVDISSASGAAVTSSATPPSSAAPTTTSSASSPPTAAALPTTAGSPTSPRPGLLVFTQLGISMQVPKGLSWVSYMIQPGRTLQDSSGVNHKSVAELDFSTPEWDAAVTANPGTLCGLNETLFVIDVWDVDPVTLVGYAYGPGMTGVIAQVNGHWLVRGGRLLPCDVAAANNPADAVATVQIPLLYTMAADARAV